MGNTGNWCVSVLAVGDPEEWVRSGCALPSDGDIAFVAFQDIDQELLEKLTPPVIMSPLLSTGFDCIDLAEVLSGVGYEGRYRVVTKRLPKPNVVIREISQLCPKLDFDLLLLE